MSFVGFSPALPEDLVSAEFPEICLWFLYAFQCFLVPGGGSFHR